MKKLLLLDKDGTLIRPKSGATFVSQPRDQEPIPGVKEAIERYHQQDWDREMLVISNQEEAAVEHKSLDAAMNFCQLGWDMVIISNQGGVAAGHKSLDSAITEMQFCLRLFPQIKEAYFCPDFDGSACWRIRVDGWKAFYTGEMYELLKLGISGQFRKPNPGMLKLAAYLHSADECLMIGDRPEDEQAAAAAGIKFLSADVWAGGSDNANG